MLKRDAGGPISPLVNTKLKKNLFIGINYYYKIHVNWSNIDMISFNIYIIILINKL